MASYQKSTARCPFLLLLVVFGALALLSPIPAYAQDLDSQLIEAATFGQTWMIKALLEAGADVAAKDDNGVTSLRVAAFNGHTETIELLKKAGAKE